jgi:hypothetical protein
LWPACAEEDVRPKAAVRIVDALLASPDLGELGFALSVAATLDRREQ